MRNEREVRLKKHKKIMVEFKSVRNKWTKAELVNMKSPTVAILKLESGELIPRCTIRKFRWGVYKKVRRTATSLNSIELTNKSIPEIIGGGSFTDSDG